MSEERAGYHALRSVRPRSFGELTRLFEKYGSWSEAAASSIAAAEIEACARNLARSQIRLILREEAVFPAPLREIPFSPWGIYVAGSLPAGEDMIAIVGTRKATSIGLGAAREFGKHFGRTRIGVVSGLALGVDRAAHEGALMGGGYALAVLANGLPEIFPKTNESLGKKILASGGTLISEYPPGAAPRPHLFLERNRIVSGLARGILLIEASERSGSLATARFALEQNRDVFVLPGPASHPNYKGSHRLIRAGAELVTEPEDILETWGKAAGTKASGSGPENPDEARIWRVLKESPHPLGIDKIIELTHLETHTVLQALSFLIIRGEAHEGAEGYTLT